jgi:phenylalanyl-tRNA synthetase beta chain
MHLVLSWLKDFVEIDLPVDELAERMTLAGLEVEEIRYVGLPMPDASSGRRVTKLSGLSWDLKTLVVGEVLEVMPHPNADRLVLCRLLDGEREHVVLTGAPNLFPYKGQGPLATSLKVAYAREGARLYDGHQPGWELMTLKRSKIRGIDSYSMACSEKEPGISEDHEGVILLDDEAPTGMPLAEYMGDAVLEVAITPNMARNANVLGVAREVAALTGKSPKAPSYVLPEDGAPIAGRAAIEIRQPDLNPRFVLGLLENVHIRPSPYWVQRRLRLAGMRPINNIVDATNYAMLEIGEPLHAFDYDVLRQRAGGKPPTIITRLPEPGERLTTLDGVDHSLDEFTVLVADTAGALSIAGVMGGAESEVSQTTRNVLLEGAAWDFINIRRTSAAQRLSSEAAYRFARGVHPAVAERGVRRGLQWMQRWSDGTIAAGLIDAYPRPPQRPTVVVTCAEAERWLGIRLTPEEMAEILRRLEFEVVVLADEIRATPPEDRLDIGVGIIGMADVMEEIARIYGYNRIPETMIADRLPPQRGNPLLEGEERTRDLLVGMGLQEVITYRLTTAEREARLLAPGASADPRPYLRLENAIAEERSELRHSLLASVMEIAERNARIAERLALFEIGPVFLPVAGRQLPEEPLRLAVVLCGPRQPAAWQGADSAAMDFFDLKGMLVGLLGGLHVKDVDVVPAEHPTFHPGKCASLQLGSRAIGAFGELHPLVQRRLGLPEYPAIAAEIDLGAVLEAAAASHPVTPVPAFPPVLEDLAVVVDENVPARQVEEVIRQAAGSLLRRLRLFDVYRGEQIGDGKKSLAYSLIYQAQDRTLTDGDVADVRRKIVRQLEGELQAKLRG